MSTRFSCPSVLLAIALLNALIGSACSPEVAEDDNGLTDDRIAADIILAGDYVVTMNEAGTVLEKASVVINGGLIVAIGASDEINAILAIYLGIKLCGKWHSIQLAAAWWLLFSQESYCEFIISQLLQAFGFVLK